MNKTPETGCPPKNGAVSTTKIQQVDAWISLIFLTILVMNYGRLRIKSSKGTYTSVDYRARKWDRLYYEVKQ